MNDVTTEPRDEHGRWTSGSGSTKPSDKLWATLHGDPNGPFVSLADPESNAAHARAISDIAGSVAKELGFNPSKINITDGEHKFTVNGKDMTAAGLAHRETGLITLYTKQLTESFTPGATAHEIMHQKWNAYLEDYRAEAAKVMTDPDGANSPYRGPDAFMKADGTLGEKYAARYPIYQEYTKLMMNSEKMRAEDGVSDYSREYWNAVNSGEANRVKGTYINSQGNVQEYTTSRITLDQCYHETLAEMARLDYENKKAKEKGSAIFNPVAPPARLKSGKASTARRSKDWEALYEAINRNWDKRSKA